MGNVCEQPFEDASCGASSGSPFANAVRLEPTCRRRHLHALHPPLHRLPIDIRQERVDVLRAVGGLVVEQVRVLSHVHHQQRDEAGHVAGLV